MQEAGDDEASLEIQQVECFERDSSTAPWQTVGEGTVLWQAGAEGRMEQRLLVMQPDATGDWGRELEALDFPDMSAALACQPEDSVITWRRIGSTREVALAFKSAEGCLQVWEDVQALQSIVDPRLGGGGPGGPGGAAGALNNSEQAIMAEYLEQFADMYGAVPGMDGLGGMGGAEPLPPPTEDSLPEILMRLSSCPPGLAPFLLQQLGGESGPESPNTPGGSAKPSSRNLLDTDPSKAVSAANLAEAAAALTKPADAPGAPPRDYVGQLAALAVTLSGPASSSSGANGTLGSPKPAGGGTPPTSSKSSLSGSKESLPATDADIVRTTRRMQLCTCFRTLLTLAADDASLLQRLLMPDALAGLLRSLELEESRNHIQTQHVNVSHVDFVTDARRFRTPAPIADPSTLAKIHQNFVISYLTDAALPLVLEPGTSAALTELQSTNGREIVQSLSTDDAFLASLLGGLCQGPPDGFATGSFAADDEEHRSTPEAPSVKWEGGVIGGVMHATPAAPAEEPLYLQRWGLLREFTTLSVLLHSINRARVYKALASHGLLRAISLALGEAVGGREYGHGLWVPRVGNSGWRNAIDSQVRALDVLLNVLNHDPAVVRLACVANAGEESQAWGGGRKEARSLVCSLVRLLGESSDEGLIIQASEAMRILIDPSSMEASEQNAFLDFLYGSGQMASILSMLRARAHETLLDGQTAHLPAVSTSSAPDAAHVKAGESTTPGAEGAGYAGPRVCRIEALLDVVWSALGVHGYRSQRLTQDDNLWMALADLLTQPRGSLRGNAARLLRAVITTHPTCAGKVQEYELIKLLIAQLWTRPAADGAPRDNLANSSVLALLQCIVEHEGLGPLRTFLLTGRHLSDMRKLAAHRVIPAINMLQGASIDLAASPQHTADTATVPSQESSAAERAHAAAAAANGSASALLGNGGSPSSSVKSPAEIFARPRSPSPPATGESRAPPSSPAMSEDASPARHLTPGHQQLSHQNGHGPGSGGGGGSAFMPSANSAFTAMRSRGAYSDSSSDSPSPQRSPPSLPTPPSMGGLLGPSPPQRPTPPSIGALSAGSGRSSPGSDHRSPPGMHLPGPFANVGVQPQQQHTNGVENYEQNRPPSPRPNSPSKLGVQPPSLVPPGLVGGVQPPNNGVAVNAAGRPLTPR